MAEFNAEVFCTKLHENVKSNQHRLDELEKREVTIYEMVTAIKEIAVEMKNLKESQDEIKRNQEKSQDEIKKSQDEMIKQIREIEKKPAKNWDKAIGALISGIVAYLVTEIFK